MHEAAWILEAKAERFERSPFRVPGEAPFEFQIARWPCCSVAGPRGVSTVLPWTFLGGLPAGVLKRSSLILQLTSIQVG